MVPHTIIALKYGAAYYYPCKKRGGITINIPLLSQGGYNIRLTKMLTSYIIFIYENRDIAITMSFSRADPVLGLNILQG